MSETAQEERIIIPSKFSCERHSYYSNDKDCPTCYKDKSITIDQLHGKVNMPLAAIVDENGLMQIVVNTDNEYTLWATWKRMEQAINFVLTQKEIRRQQTAVQAAPASVLDKLRG